MWFRFIFTDVYNEMCRGCSCNDLKTMKKARFTRGKEYDDTY